MPFDPAPRLSLQPGDRQRLLAISSDDSSPKRDVLRARIILLCADGVPHRGIVRQLHTSVDAVVRWRSRYEQEGLDGLKDRPRTGRPRIFARSGAT